jgi:hypothetical protein
MCQALAQDQRLAMDQLLRKCPSLEEIQVFTYDGDTPKEKREGIFSRPLRPRSSSLICSYRNQGASLCHFYQFRVSPSLKVPGQEFTTISGYATCLNSTTRRAMEEVWPSPTGTLTYLSTDPLQVSEEPQDGGSRRTSLLLRYFRKVHCIPASFYTLLRSL